MSIKILIIQISIIAKVTIVSAKTRYASINPKYIAKGMTEIIPPHTLQGIE